MAGSKEKHEVMFEKEDAYKSLEITNSWIGNLDTKASFLLAYLSVVMGFVVSHGVPVVFSTTPTAPLGMIYWAKIICAIGLYFSLILSAVFLLGTLTARINGKGNKPSLLFFGEISKQSLNDYKSKILNRTEDELIKDILEQIHTNAEICTKKSKYYNFGVKFVFVATVLYIACMGIGVL
ncbi:Pycsar system effector family protein [Oribacterium sp.]